MNDTEKEALFACIDKLCVENEKLRKLSSELFNELDAATQYDAGGGRGVMQEFGDRMHELGVN